jgi:Variant SH3 domain/Sel1 repeat
MKSATFGVGDCRWRASVFRGYLSKLYCGGRVSAAPRDDAVLAYRASRQNGTWTDNPLGPLPEDGACTWHKGTDGKYQVKYTEGPGDREWMEQCDRNYLARLDREKQSAARKQEREAQLREAQEKLKREQQLKEKAEQQLKVEQQLKALEAICREAEAARLAVLQAQQSQTPGIKLSLSEVLLAAHQGNADAQFQLGQRYAGGLDVKLDKKEALQWFKKAAAEGHAPAQIALGRAYEKGEGTKKNFSSAQKWYAKAAVLHASHAEKRLARVKQRIAEQKSSSHHSSTTQSSTSHSSGGREQDCSGSPTPQAGSSSAGTCGYSLDSPSLRPPPPIPIATLMAEVLYPFQGTSAEELSLSGGERVRVVDRVTPDWWRCEHDGQAGLVPSSYLRTLSSAQVPSALPAGYTGYTTPTSGEALGTAGIFPAITPSSAANQSGRPEEELDTRCLLDNKRDHTGSDKCTRKS